MEKKIPLTYITNRESEGGGVGVEVGSVKKGSVEEVRGGVGWEYAGCGERKEVWTEWCVVVLFILV